MNIDEYKEHLHKMVNRTLEQIMDVIQPYCRDEYAVQNFLEAELLALAYRAALLAVMDGNKQLESLRHDA